MFKSKLWGFLPLNASLSSLCHFTKTWVVQSRRLEVFLDFFSSFILQSYFIWSLLLCFQVIFLSFIFFHIPSCHRVFAPITLNDLPSFLSLIPTFLLKYLFCKEVFLDFPDESTNSNKGYENTEYF